MPALSVVMLFHMTATQTFERLATLRSLRYRDHMHPAFWTQRTINRLSHLDTAFRPGLLHTLVGPTSASRPKQPAAGSETNEQRPVKKRAEATKDLNPE